MTHEALMEAIQSLDEIRHQANALETLLRDSVFGSVAVFGAEATPSAPLTLAASESSPAATPAPPLAENIAPKPLFARPPRKMAGM